MTNNDKLEPCPLCGAGPYYPSNWKKNKTITSCANNKCPIFGINMTVKQWNTRATQPPAEELLIEAVDYLERGCELYCRWYDTGEPRMEGGSMAYEMVSFMRQALAKIGRV